MLNCEGEFNSISSCSRGLLPSVHRISSATDTIQQEPDKRLMYGGHSVLRSNSKLHNNFGKMETRARTAPLRTSYGVCAIDLKSLGTR